MSAGQTVRLITDNSFYILLALNVIGVQLFGVGLAVELLLRESNKKHDYTVDKKSAIMAKVKYALISPTFKRPDEVTEFLSSLSL